MPYHWTDHDTHSEAHLPAHKSLPPQGFVWFMGATCLLISVPLLSLLGSMALWGLLPFLALAVALQWLLIRRNQRDRTISELLTISAEDTTLVRHNPRAEDQTWDCNTYWVRVNKYDKDAPMPHYVTLSGSGREVEIGSFLSEDERIALYGDLQARLSEARG